MSKEKTKKPWGGRFKSEMDPVVQEFTRSVHLDRRLAPYDIQGSRAHVRMLAAQGIVSVEDEKRILEGLKQIEEEIKSDEFPYRDELEDIHMNIEHRLQEIVGEAGGRLHPEALLPGDGTFLADSDSGDPEKPAGACPGTERRSFPRLDSFAGCPASFLGALPAGLL
jgi:hypothetical protein